MVNLPDIARAPDMSVLVCAELRGDPTCKVGAHPNRRASGNYDFPTAKLPAGTASKSTGEYRQNNSGMARHQLGMPARNLGKRGT
jgi:hypothetical protein